MPPASLTGKPGGAHINNFRKSLLAWYDKNRRAMPWRAPPGRHVDPYQVWLSEVMLQQTVVNAVIPYFLKFIKKWPTVHDLAAALVDDVMAAWAGLGYYVRARNLHKCAKEISARDGVFPDSIEELKKLPGIGDYTSAAITAIAFDKPATVIDGNVERVVARYFNITEPLPAAKKKIRQYADFLSSGRGDRPGDFAQAMMDLGATVCIPQSPRCGMCPLQQNCAGKNIAETLPRRAPRMEKPLRRGHIYWIMDGKGKILLQKRPERGLLGGMNGFPTSEWVEKGRPGHPDFIKRLIKNKKSQKNRVVAHSFTHFDLILQGWIVETASIQCGEEGFFWRRSDDLDRTAFPTVFKKFARLMID